MQKKVLLKASGISKSYAGSLAIENIDIQLYAGEVHALVGENGAGKSTLVKILSGGLKADSGQMTFADEVFSPLSPANAHQSGVSIVHQELSLSPYLSVAENIFLGNANEKFLSRKKELYRKTSELQKKYDCAVNPYRWVSDIPLEEQQIVEILKALSCDPQVIIFDEPTSALGHLSTRWLLDLIERFKKNKAVLFISHRLPEVMQLADRITVLKDGKKIDTVSSADTSETEIVKMMVGRTLEAIFPPKPDVVDVLKKQTLLEAKNLKNTALKNVSFSLHKGEVIGIAGLEGQGQHDLLQTLFGLQPLIEGKIYINTVKTKIKNPARAIKNGLAFVPMDRRIEGLVLPLSVSQNIALPTLNKRHRGGLVKLQVETKIVQSIIERLAIKTRSLVFPVMHLSGGNQQKIAFGKWLPAEPKVFILDDPTRGVDIQARSDIYYHIRSLAKQGLGVIFSSTDALELIGLCDRVLVMYEGAIIAELLGNEITEENIVRSAVGLQGDGRHEK